MLRSCKVILSQYPKLLIYFLKNRHLVKDNKNFETFIDDCWQYTFLYFLKSLY